jgi:hypothetical protein
MGEPTTQHTVDARPASSASTAGVRSPPRGRAQHRGPVHCCGVLVRGDHARPRGLRSALRPLRTQARQHHRRRPRCRQMPVPAGCHQSRRARSRPYSPGPPLRTRFCPQLHKAATAPSLTASSRSTKPRWQPTASVAATPTAKHSHGALIEHRADVSGRGSSLPRRWLLYGEAPQG